ncbi:MAG: menaquinone biosynthesis decarboxylase [Bacteroidetes bacterium HGW-Bacteroidetes-6]|jgi:4-hydroxy-3-polyprenylbenzoate decarboxylase|nr:MAG: menaquinone biosynthesis decarboxylase [Bacteroidetes bacterium HGW-Bacteroidetes-6]
MRFFVNNYTSNSHKRIRVIMAFFSLSDITGNLRKSNQLIEINRYVDTELELSEIADRMASAGNDSKTLVFNNNGTEFPLLTNLYSTRKQTDDLLRLLGKKGYFERLNSLLLIPDKGVSLSMSLLKTMAPLRNLAPKRCRGKGKCQKMAMEVPDLNLLPIMKCWPYDGGRFITLPLVHTVHPETGQQNTGMYRMQIFDGKTTGMHWHRHKGGAAHFEAWKKKGGKMPVTVTLGGDPVLTYAATAPLPEGISENMLAGFMKNEKVKLVRSVQNKIWIPECSDFVIEGYIDTAEPLRIEGPFGDHTGFYSLPDEYPVFHVTKISYRKNAVYPSTLVGVPPKEDKQLGDTTSRIFFPLIQKTLVPEIIDLVLPAEGGFHNLALVKIKKSYPGQAVKVMHALWGAGQMMFTKVIAVFSEETDIRNSKSVLNALARNFSAVNDLHMSAGPYDVLDHAAQSFSHGGKAGFDCTAKLPEEKKVGTQSVNNLNNTSMRTFGNSLHVIFSNHAVAESGNLFLSLTSDDTNKASGIYVIADSQMEKAPDDILLWHILSAIDPGRDFSLVRSTSSDGALVINACTTGKRAVPGNRWPAATVMSEEVQRLVDERWHEYEIGPFIESPSKRLKMLDSDSFLK